MWDLLHSGSFWVIEVLGDVVHVEAVCAPDRDHPGWDFGRIMDTCWQWVSEGRFQCEEIVYPVVSLAESVQAYRDMDLHPEDFVELGVVFPTISWHRVRSDGDAGMRPRDRRQGVAGDGAGRLRETLIVCAVPSH